MRLFLPLAALLAVPSTISAQSALPDTEAIDAAVETFLVERAVPGAVVGILDGTELVFRRSYGHRDLEKDEPMREDTLFQIGSVTKTMTATLLVLLRDEGRLSLDDPVAKHLPAELELPPELARITLRQLVTHTSGLPRNPVNRENVPDTPSVAKPYSALQLHEGLARTELVHPPGEKWDYSNLGFALLGHVLERASGKSYEELAREKLWGPLGMSSTGVQPTPEQEKRLAVHYWDQDDPRTARERWIFGEVCGHGGVFSSLDDLARFVAWQYSPREDAPLSAESLAELHRPAVANRPDESFGFAWFLYRLPPDIDLIGHGGEVDGHSTAIAFLPEERAGLIVLTNLGGSTAEDLSRLVLRLAFRP
jgi:CubicO group peptidase (beta-lactamase class C family)